MKKIFLFSLLFLGFLFISYSPKTTSGIVVDSVSGEALTGVQIISKYETVYTDFDGEFHIKGTPLKSNFISYQLEKITADTIYLKSVN